MIESHQQKPTFELFKKYCSGIAGKINSQSNYSASYKISNNPFLREHDGEFLQIQYHNQNQLIKINITYSLPYSIPIILFMVYKIDNSEPLRQQQIYEKYLKKTTESNDLLQPSKQTGIYLTQNPINKEYFYTLHSCQMKLPINLLIPFYLSLLGLHPQI